MKTLVAAASVLVLVALSALQNRSKRNSALLDFAIAAIIALMVTLHDAF